MLPVSSNNKQQQSDSAAELGVRPLAELSATIIKGSYETNNY